MAREQQRASVNGFDRYCKEDVIQKACQVLEQDEQSEEEFLGAQGVLMLCGMI